MVNKILFSSESEEWETPQELFDLLNKEFRFKLDPCATKKNRKCDLYFSKEFNGLTKNWAKYKSIFMNPPYGKQIGKWIKKAYEESQRGCLVVCLLPARTDVKWFHDYCLKGEIRFIKGRIKFSGAKNSAPFPSMIIIFKGVR